MANRDRNAAMDTLIGAGVLFAIVVVIAIGSDDNGQAGAGSGAPPSIEGLTLAGYADLDAERRQPILAAAAAAAGAPEADLPHYVACMGEFAATKDPELSASKVFGWCDTERTSNRERFTSHFNELDAADLSTEAQVMCRRFVEGQLTAPGEADFPWVAGQVRDMGRQTYAIRSHVDAATPQGGEVRLPFICRVRYSGSGDVLRPASWELEELALG